MKSSHVSSVPRVGQLHFPNSISHVSFCVFFRGWARSYRHDSLAACVWYFHLTENDEVIRFFFFFFYVESSLENRVLWHDVLTATLPGSFFYKHRPYPPLVISVILQHLVALFLPGFFPFNVLTPSCTSSFYFIPLSPGRSIFLATPPPPAPHTLTECCVDVQCERPIACDSGFRSYSQAYSSEGDLTCSVLFCLSDWPIAIYLTLVCDSKSTRPLNSMKQFLLHNSNGWKQAFILIFFW